MSYKTILVHLNDHRRADRLLAAAVPLARRWDAHLIGLGILPPFVVIPAMDGAGASVTVDEHRKAYQGELARLKRAFGAATSDLQRPGEWREVDAGLGTTAAALIQVARTADLVVAAQADREWPSSALLEDPSRVAIECGRPLLVIPNRGTVSMPPKRVTVAWNARREAARAAFDALPLLKEANEVDVLSIRGANEPSVSGDLPGAEICATLARHGVKCSESEATAASVDVGTEILRRAEASGAELVVMGCYGHSRLREFVLGGASREVLAHMRLPVLLSH